MTGAKGASAEPLEFVSVGAVADFQEGSRWFLEIDARSIALLRIAERWYALANVCTHDDGPLGEGKVLGGEIECPRHGGRFNLETGRATQLPALEDIPVYPVRVQAGQVQIGIPRVPGG